MPESTGTRTALRKIVIVGNGIAGLTAADSLRADGFDGELTIVGAEHRAAYSRPALSKALLRHDADLTAHDLPAPEHGAVELLGRAAIRLDPERRLLALDDDSELAYDGLIVTSGSRARRLGSSANELVLRTLDDALTLRTRIAARPHLIIVGGGPLGMEVASGALEAGCRVTLVANETPMLRHLGSHLAATILRSATERGLTVISGRAIGLLDSLGGTTIVLSDGRRVRGDLVLTAIGDDPNTEWLTRSGLPTAGPILVDSRGRVRSDIVAAGDVAAFPIAGRHVRSPIWHSAIDQARVAASALLHGDDAPELELRPYFWTEQFDLTVRVAGATPLLGAPELIEGDRTQSPSLLRWRHSDGSGTAVAINYRIPIPRLRRLCEPAA